MRARIWILGAAALLALAPIPGIAQTATADQTASGPLPEICASLLHDAYVNSRGRAPNDTDTAIENAVDILAQPNATSCLQALVEQQTTATAQDLKPKISAARTDLLTAVSNYSSQQQKGATTSSTSVVSPVSKVAGLSSVAEEFAGVNVSSASNSQTFSLSMQSLMEDLVHQGVVLPCSPNLGVEGRCLDKGWYAFTRRFTASVTASSSSAVNGTATSTASPTPVTLSTPGSTWPSFGGFGLKGVAFYRNDSAKSSTGVSDLMKSALDVAQMAQMCKDYPRYLDLLTTNMSGASTQDAFNQAFLAGYPKLLDELAACLDGNSSNVATFKNFVTQQVISTIADIDANTTPVLGFEYDLNTPLNQPSYSTAKANLSLQFGKTAVAKSSATTPAAQNTASKSSTAGKESKSAANAGANKRLSAWAKAVALTIPSSESSAAVSDTAGNNPSPTTTVAPKTTKAAAAAQTPPWTINLMIDGEFYNSQPPSSVPSSSRLRDVQIGFEADYILHGSDKYWLTKLIGDSTLSASYLYQDQTSPSIVNAPPSGISFSNLPSTATTVYTSKGHINLGQLRWGLGTGSNVSFPIAFTYSNRSALIAHPIAGLQFGLSYNLTSLFASASK